MDFTRFKQLVEANEKPKTTTKTKSDLDLDFDIDLDPKQHTVAKPEGPRPGPGPKVTPKGVSRDQTMSSLRSTLSADQTARAAGHLGNLDAAMQGMDSDEMSDDEFLASLDLPTPGGYPDEPKEPSKEIGFLQKGMTTIPSEWKDVPAILGQKYNVNFHEVRNLPGMIQRSIRMLGRSLFGTLTSYPLDNVLCVSSFTNTDRDVNNVAGFAKKNAQQESDLDFDFARVMPGYTAKGYLSRVGDTTFMVIEDFAGKYVYSWPSEYDKQIQWKDVASLPNEQKQLSMKREFVEISFAKSLLLDD